MGIIPTVTNPNFSTKLWGKLLWQVKAHTLHHPDPIPWSHRQLAMRYQHLWHPLEQPKQQPQTSAPQVGHGALTQIHNTGKNINLWYQTRSKPISTIKMLLKWPKKARDIHSTIRCRLPFWPSWNSVGFERMTFLSLGYQRTTWRSASDGGDHSLTPYLSDPQTVIKLLEKQG